MGKKKILGQPEINIGLVGHVDHGKTTLVKALSGKWTDTHSEELKRGITIRLGYADAVFYKDKDGYNTEGKGDPIRVVSFVDAPGHESLMATMLAGATIMDGALLLISASEKCPQTQTKEHLMALEIVGIDQVIIVQNKVDLVSEEQAKKNYDEIKAFIKGTKFEKAPIIPISAQHSINTDVLIETIEKVIKTPKRDEKLDPLLFVARSFDINKPGSPLDKMVGGVLGGAIQQGKFSEGQEIEILPGYETEKQNKKVWVPLKTTITGMMTGGEIVKELIPGGSVAVMTSLDPAVVKSDKLTGALVGMPGKLPPVWYDFTLDTHLLERVVGVKEEGQVEPIKMKELLMLNVNSAATVGIVKELGKNSFKCTLKLPVCAQKGSRVTISRRVGTRFRLIGYGIIKQKNI